MQFIDPKESGAVIPILHVKCANPFTTRQQRADKFMFLLSGYKISERTLPGTMDDLELVTLFTGYGYQVCFVEYGELPNSKEESKAKTVALNKSMAVSMEWAYQEIRFAALSASLHVLALTVWRIRKIQKAARSGKPIVKPRWPVIILRTPKVRPVPFPP